MKTLRLRTLSLLLAAIAVAIPAAAQVDTGSADFTRYVALGDSLTHGFANGGVVASVQVNSYPALIARQAGAGDFQQPLISPPGIPGLLELVSLVPPVIRPRPGNGAPTNLNLPRPYNNLGVSGFDVRDVLLTVTANPLVDTVLRRLGTPLQQALALRPTFVTLWIGNNDALGAATSGIVIDNVTLTTADRFEADYRAIAGALAAAGAQLTVATIPPVTAIPFVTTVPPVVVDPATRRPVLVGGQVVPLIGPRGPLNPATDRVLLSATVLLAQGIGIPAALGGTGRPLPDSAVLDGGEIARIDERVAAFNSIIRAVANDTGAALFDAHALFSEIAREGFDVGGIELTFDFLTGGLVSYDGVHPTPLGYAITANAFIEAINQRFGADIPPVDLFPFLFGSEGAGGTALGAAQGAPVFAKSATQSLLDALRIPDAKTLSRLQGDPPAGPGTTPRQVPFDVAPVPGPRVP